MARIRGRKWLTAPQAARLLQISVSQLRKLYRTGILPVRRVGKDVRFHEDELDKAFKAKREQKEKHGRTS